MSKFKNIALTGCALVFVAVSYTAFKGYKLSTKPSNLELALQKLDFNGYRTSSSLVTKATEQESLLKILYFAGYFSPEQLWRDINKIGKIENTEKAFQSIYNIPNLNHFAHSVSRKLSVIRLANVSNIRGIELSKNSNIAFLKS